MDADWMTDVLARCRDGDDAAWAALLDHFEALVLSVPRRYGLAEADVEEVYGEVSLRLVRSLGTIREPAAMPAWMIRLATRVTWEVARKRAKQPEHELPELTGGAPPAEVVARFEREQIVREAVAALPERCRDLLRLLYFVPESPNYDEIAARLGVPRGSLGPTRRRCLDRLQRKIERPLGLDVSKSGSGGLEGGP